MSRVKSPTASRARDDLAVLNRELTAWQNLTSAGQWHVNWHFTTSDARTRHPYPHLLDATVY